MGVNSNLWDLAVAWRREADSLDPENSYDRGRMFSLRRAARQLEETLDNSPRGSGTRTTVTGG